MESNVFCEAVYDLRCQVTHEGVLTNITENSPTSTGGEMNQLIT